MSKAFFLPVSGRRYAKQRADPGKKGAVGTPGSKPCCNQFRGLNMYRNTLACTNISNTSSTVKLAAVADSGSIWTSLDSGATWKEDTSVGSPKAWSAITSSSDGTKLAATVFGENIWISTNSGASWTELSGGAPHPTPNLDWQAITSSSDGTKLAAAVYTGNIWTSTDSGATWTELFGGFPPNPTINQQWKSIASSSDGDRLAAVIGFATPAHVWTSDGSVWTEQLGSPSQLWSGIASSSDGVKLAATVGSVVGSGFIWVSIDYGVTWQSRASSQLWSCITSSSDGVKLAATVYNGNIWTSSDSGTTWQSRASSRFWQSIASSPDGVKLVAAVSLGNIWTSTDSGVNWTELAGGAQYPTPNLQWTSVTLSEASEETDDKCQTTTTKVYKDNLSQCPPELCYSPVAKSTLNKTIDGSTTVDLSYNRTTRQLLQSRCMTFASNTSTCAHSVPGSTRGSCCNQSCNQVVYKPSNTSFDTQGAVPSGNRIALLKYNARVTTPSGQYLRSNYTSDPSGKKIFPCGADTNAQRQNITKCKRS